jgi:ATP-dependent exoDNAse (exonuclease V) beta subunit
VRLRKGFETAGFNDASQANRQLDEQESQRLLYVGMIRAADHLAISLYHNPPKHGMPNCHAMRLFAQADQLAHAGAAHEQSAATAIAPAESPGPAPAAVSLEERERFIAARRRLLARVTATVPTTATVLARVAAAADSMQEPTDPLAAVSRPEVADEPDAPARQPVARSGATLGSTVHRALELLDLVAPTGQAVNLAVAAACGELGVPRFAGEVLERVRSALQSPTVRLAGTNRHWKEVPIVADIGGRIVEGFIDLLVDTSDGLVVVDYKTDPVRTEAEVAEKTATYTPQITAYAKAVATAGLQVHQAILCFISKDTVVEMKVLTGLNQKTES